MESGIEEVDFLVVGSDASALVQEIVVAMTAGSGTVRDIRDAVHIHPALPEVIDRAFTSQFVLAGDRGHEHHGHGQTRQRQGRVHEHGHSRDRSHARDNAHGDNRTHDRSHEDSQDHHDRSRDGGQDHS